MWQASCGRGDAKLASKLTAVQELGRPELRPPAPRTAGRVSCALVGYCVICVTCRKQYFVGFS